MPDQSRTHQLLVDVSEISRNDLHAGIERVVRAQLSQLLRNPPAGYRVEPIYLSDEGGVPHDRYARRFTLKLLSLGETIIEDAAVKVKAGDIFYGADFCPSYVIRAAAMDIYRNWRASGVETNFLIHDILPILRPDFFPDGVDRQHAAWLKCIAENGDRLICISRSVANEVSQWLELNGMPAHQGRKIDVVHHGADIDGTVPSKGMPSDAPQILEHMQSATSFLMVGTIEPRKGHWQTLLAFEQLWAEGSPVQLVIVGREGWASLQPHQRRTIPRIVERLCNHTELGKRLIWLSDISDEYLQQVYAASTCLVFASEGEGFGLPLIEAAKSGRPIIARDISVFREIAQNHAYFFMGLSPDDLAHAVRKWLILHANGATPSSEAMPFNTWARNVEELCAILTGQTDLHDMQRKSA